MRVEPIVSWFSVRRVCSFGGGTCMPGNLMPPSSSVAIPNGRPKRQCHAFRSGDCEGISRRGDGEGNEVIGALHSRCGAATEGAGESAPRASPQDGHRWPTTVCARRQVGARTGRCFRRWRGSRWRPQPVGEESNRCRPPWRPPRGVTATATRTHRAPLRPRPPANL